MRYICEDCGEEFNHPRKIRKSEPMPDGFYEEQLYLVCPNCGSAYFIDEEEENGLL